ncbi:hypothetical protein EIK76_01315 [Rheinheimera mesophila]|uniref:Uncharacterized protein n=1 Tax=Rheinheimera mesophila TaxID=1547515 RepID=A0A3P3QNJ8_9GAMM|nr:hypothetical protein [Rheinheimera mesophila]KKK99832.1 hypothetical protein SD53_17720 [Rheinheimera mesophila]RRJ22754.1 hypothetical protein EIK76_01315 [Rheinheimera mesophila]
MKDFKDKSFKLSPPTGRGTGFNINRSNTHGGQYTYRETRGLVETIHGFVVAYSHFYSKSQYQGSCLSIIKNGVQYHRFFEKEFKQKTLVTLAKKFAADVFSNESAKLLAHDIELAEKAYSAGFLDGYHQEEVLNNPDAAAAEGASQYTTFFASKAGANTSVEALASLAAHDAEVAKNAVTEFVRWATVNVDPEFAEWQDFAEKYAASLSVKAGAA